MDSLDLDGPYGISEAGFAALVAELDRVDPRTIVEFGSGISTVRLAQAFPRARILSIDHEPGFADRTRELAREHGIAGDQVEVRAHPLRWQRFGATFHLTYDRPALPKGIDAVLIDGPPGRTRRGREACLYLVWDRLRVGGVLFLDDMFRSEEQRTAENWRLRLPDGFECRMIPEGHGLLVLTKLANSGQRRFPPAAMVDNYGSIGFNFVLRPMRRALLRMLARD
jgi:predicted O-methyltransferase YrrM